MRMLPLSLLVLVLVGCGSRQPLATVPYVDLDRMTGTWYTTHHIPYWLEEGKIASGDIYVFQPDGAVDIRFFFREEDFSSPEESWDINGYVKPRTGNAHWRVSFFWPIYVDYLIIATDPEYRWLVVGHPSRDYLWLLSRTRLIDPAERDRAFAIAEAKGYDPTRFAAVPQVPDVQ